MPLKTILLLMLCMSSLLSFTSYQSKDLSPGLPEQHLPLPLIAQAHSWSCGAAAMLSVLSYWQVYDGNESSLYSGLGTTDQDGTDPLNMAKFAQSLDLEAEVKVNQTIADLYQGLLHKKTVILDIQAWGGTGTDPIDYENRWEDGHYVVLVAIDRAYLYFMDPSVIGGYAFMAKKDLVKRWHDYEIRNGERVENMQLAIYIQGSDAVSSFPKKLLRID